MVEISDRIVSSSPTQSAHKSTSLTHRGNCKQPAGFFFFFYIVKNSCIVRFHHNGSPCLRPESCNFLSLFLPTTLLFSPHQAFSSNLLHGPLQPRRYQIKGIVVARFGEFDRFYSVARLGHSHAAEWIWTRTVSNNRRVCDHFGCSLEPSIDFPFELTQVYKQPPK